MRIFLFLAIIMCTSAMAQRKFTLSGYIKDAETGEGMIAATVKIAGTSIGTTSNQYGFYSLSLEEGEHEIEWSYVGFLSKKENIKFDKDMSRNVELTFASTTLSEVLITDEKLDANITSSEMSVEKLNLEQVKKIPQLLGEADIIRTIQMLPGVTTVGEGATGFNVRGGNIDQNLILLDESPVYSSSHLFGFFSVFNADAIKDVKLYKGGIPAKYGGRLSSVLDIRQKEGNSKKFSGSGGVGLLFSRLTLEGPIVKDKASFIVSGRRSYFDIFFPLANDDRITDSRLYFYDLNGKINWTINDNNRIFISGYTGDDVFNLNGLFRTRWGNRTATLRWNHLFNEKVFANFTGIYSNYNYALGVDQNAFGFNWSANIINYSVKSDFTYYPNPQNTIEFGLHTIYYEFNPGKAQAYFETNDQTDTFNFKIPMIPALESAVYLSNEQRIGTRLTLAYGVRYSGFAQLANGPIYTYPNGLAINPDEPGSTLEPTDSLTLKKRELVTLFHGVEPRFSMNFQIDEYSSVKTSYNRMRQYIHLISNTTAATPVDIYMPAGTYIKPAIVDQIALGYFRNYLQNRFESSFEVYYKNIKDIVDYKNGAELLLNNRIETELFVGQGRAYGFEMQLKKNKGDLTGWVSYTLSRTELVTTKINRGSYEKNGGAYENITHKTDQVNFGEYYPANWDKVHNVNLVVSYDISKSINVSSNFTYMTGRPITYPDGRFTYGGVTAPVYTNRNGGRTPAYHRLDLAMTFVLSKEKHNILPVAPVFIVPPVLPLYYLWRYTPIKKWVDMDMSVGVYNVYGRKNPYSIYFQQDENDPEITKAFRLSIYAIPIPYVTVNFKF